MPAPTFANPPATLGSTNGETLPPALEGEIRRIYARSPFYMKRFPLHSEALQWSCYREIPALSKKEIIERGHQAFLPTTRPSSADSRPRPSNTSRRAARPSRR